jgi:hypothetical protein
MLSITTGRPHRRLDLATPEQPGLAPGWGMTALLAAEHRSTWCGMTSSAVSSTNTRSLREESGFGTLQASWRTWILTQAAPR